MINDFHRFQKKYPLGVQVRFMFEGLIYEGTVIRHVRAPLYNWVYLKPGTRPLLGGIGLRIFDDREMGVREDIIL